jgi:cytochrome c-type biogenesis protein CcmI
VTAVIEVVLLVLTVGAAVWVVSLPLLRPPASTEQRPALAAHEESRVRLFAALEELASDRKTGMISQADYVAAVGEIRRRLSRL